MHDTHWHKKVGAFPMNDHAESRSQAHMSFATKSNIYHWTSQNDLTITQLYHWRFIYYSSCFYIHNSIGAASLCLAWFSLVLSMRKFPKLGIYVVMFTEMFRTFAQFFVVLLLFIIAFGLGFHVLLYDQARIINGSIYNIIFWLA